MTTRHSIRFMLDGELVTLDNVDPTRTVLQYLREDRRQTGTKEGCAEGDCGACTVVVAELDASEEDLRVRAINSCIQFLPTLDGKELITVESLAGAGDDLHPVQRAMVDCHGSQCGFCTPGFVMSLFALYKSNAKPARRDVDDTLSGNLCRCTGYRPIVTAAQSMYSLDAGDDWMRQPGPSTAPASRIDALKAIADEALIETGRDGRLFFSPATMEQLAEVLERYPNATILAGGTDVGLWVTKQHRELDTVVYTGRVRELLDCAASDTHIEIGAAVTLTDAMPTMLAHYPLLEELWLRFSSPLIRNAGTLGGNVANGSPIGDSMPALMAAGTLVVLRSAKGRREVALDDFYHDYMVNEIQPGEFVESLRVPLPENGTELRSYKISKRFDQDISAVCGAFRTRVEKGVLTDLRVVFGGMAATTLGATHCEQAMLNREWNADTVAAGMAALEADFRPIDDMRASASYRLRVAQNLLQRLYQETTSDTVASLYEYGRAG